MFSISASSILSLGGLKAEVTLRRLEVSGFGLAVVIAAVVAVKLVCLDYVDALIFSGHFFGS